MQIYTNFSFIIYLVRGIEGREGEKVRIEEGWEGRETESCFHENSIFNLNGETIDLLCIKLIIRTVGA